jgi:hypothetical protein
MVGQADRGVRIIFLSSHVGAALEGDPVEVEATSVAGRGGVRECPRKTGAMREDGRTTKGFSQKGQHAATTAGRQGAALDFGRSWGWMISPQVLLSTSQIHSATYMAGTGSARRSQPARRRLPSQRAIQAGGRQGWCCGGGSRTALGGEAAAVHFQETLFEETLRKRLPR